MVNESFFSFDLLTILSSFQVIHCGKNIVQESEIYTESNVIGILEKLSHYEPAACVQPSGTGEILSPNRCLQINLQPLSEEMVY